MTAEEMDCYKAKIEVVICDVYDRGYQKGILAGNIQDGTISKTKVKAYENGIADTLEAVKMLIGEYRKGVSFMLHDEKRYGEATDCMLNATVEDVKWWIKTEKHKEESKDWYDIPTADMTVEQLRQAVGELREKLADTMDKKQSWMGYTE